MLIKTATTRECEYLFRRKLERRGHRFERHKRKLFPKASITLTQTGSSHPANTPGTVTLSGSVAAGDLIIVGINWGNNVGTYQVQDGAGNLYTQFPSVQSGNTGFNDLNAFWAINTSPQSSLTVTVTISGGGSHGMRLAIFEYACSTGWAASPVDQGNSQHNATSVIVATPNTISPTVTGTLGWSAIQFVVAVTGINMTAGGSVLFTEQPTSGGTATTGWTSDGRADSADRVLDLTTNQTATYNWTTSSGYSALIANFKPGSGVTPPSGPTISQRQHYGSEGSSMFGNIVG
jgi:hypothetical protein